MRAPQITLIIGPPLIRKSELLLRFELAAAQRHTPIIFVNTDTSPEELRENAIQVNDSLKTLDAEGKVHYIDCYSLHMNQEKEDTQSVTRVPGPIALTELCVAMQRVQKQFLHEPCPHLVVFNSLSSVLLYANTLAVVRFVQVLIGKIRDFGGKCIFTLEEGMHDPKVVVSIQHLMDENITVRKERGKLLYQSTNSLQEQEWESIEIV